MAKLEGIKSKGTGPEPLNFGNKYVTLQMKYEYGR